MAVLLVMAFHGRYPALVGGHIGVDLFFVLSGFLITTLLLQEWATAGRIDWKGFYLRRAIRLLPALYVLLAVYLAADLLFPGNHLLPGWEAAFYAGAHISNLISAASGNLGCLSHTWSLSIEAQFYVIWPLGLVLMLQRRLPTRTIVRVLLVCAAACSLWRMLLFLQAPGHRPTIDRLYNGLDTRADALLVGCALAAAWAADLVPSVLRSRFAVIAASVLLLGSAQFIPDTSGWLYFGGYTLLAASAAVVLIRLLERPPALFTYAPLMGLGKISYGLYLWHMPVFAAFDQAPIRTPLMEALRWGLSFALAGLSFYLVERPGRKRKRQVAAAMFTTSSA